MRTLAPVLELAREDANNSKWSRCCVEVTSIDSFLFSSLLRPTSLSLTASSPTPTPPAPPLLRCTYSCFVFCVVRRALVFLGASLDLAAGAPSVPLPLYRCRAGSFPYFLVSQVCEDGYVVDFGVVKKVSRAVEAACT